MKTAYKVPSIVLAVIAASHPKLGLTKLEQACESYLNGMKPVEEKSGRGVLRELKKSADARVTESTSTVYAGEQNIVAKFISWTDRVEQGRVKMAKLECEVSVKLIPTEFTQWLAKFDTEAKPATPAKAKAVKANKPEASNGNGAPESNRLAGVSA